LKASLPFILLAAMIPVIGLLASPATTSTATAITDAPAITHAPFQGISGISNATSPNWSGYAAHGAAHSFNSVSASWVQPAGHCTSETTYAAFWVGLDGYTSSTVEQTGTEVDCMGGSPKYYTWYEMYPAFPVNFGNAVSPGDQFTASVTASGFIFTLKIADTTKGWSHTVTKSRSSAQRSSAEVIAEAPCCTAAGDILPLTDFGTVQFSQSGANGLAIGKSSPTQINMGPVLGSSTNTDHSSKLSSGNAFSVTWVGN